MITSFVTDPTAPVTQVFNNKNAKLYGGDGKHKGIDFGVPVGTPVYACMSGTVTVATNSKTGYGRHIRILHEDGSLSIYGHLSTLGVRIGDIVQYGNSIGLSGGDQNDKIDGDGTTTGAHLHWEIRPPNLHATDQTSVDPMEYCIDFDTTPYTRAEVIADGGLNVRVAPDAKSKSIHLLKRKESVRVAFVTNGWARLISLRPEWVSVKYLSHIVSATPPVELTLEEKVARLWALHPELHR